MRYYELAYLIDPDFSEEEAKDFKEKINSTIQEKGGILDIKDENFSKKELSYPIKRKTTAWFTFVDFYFPPQKIEEFKKELEKKEGVLRVLIFQKKKSSKKVQKEKKENVSK